MTHILKHTKRQPKKRGLEMVVDKAQVTRDASSWPEDI